MPEERKLKGSTIVAPKPEYFPEKEKRKKERSLEKDAEELKRQSRAAHGGVTRGTYKF